MTTSKTGEDPVLQFTGKNSTHMQTGPEMLLFDDGQNRIRTGSENVSSFNYSLRAFTCFDFNVHLCCDFLSELFPVLACWTIDIDLSDGPNRAKSGGMASRHATGAQNPEGRNLLASEILGGEACSARHPRVLYKAVVKDGERLAIGCAVELNKSTKKTGANAELLLRMDVAVIDPLKQIGLGPDRKYRRICERAFHRAPTVEAALRVRGVRVHVDARSIDGIA